MPFSHNILIVFILIALLVCGFISMSRKRGLSWETGLIYFSSLCIIIGFVGIITPVILTLGHVKLPKSFEWPVNDGYCLPISGEKIICPVLAAGRIQIYDSSLKFIHGWQINASGGSFKLVAADDNVSYFFTITRPSGDYRISAKYTDSFYIYTARTSKRMEYNVEGDLIASEEYTGDFSEFEPDNLYLTPFKIRTPAYFWPIASPLNAIILILFGVMINIIRKWGIQRIESDL